MNNNTNKNTNNNTKVNPNRQIVLLVLLAILASGCVMATPTEGRSGGGNMRQIVSGPDGGQMIELKGAKITPAAGLPEGEPDVVGLYQRRDDSSLFLGTGEIEITVEIPKEGADPVTKASANGPTVEVVVNRNTQIYKDITNISFEARRDGLEVQQVVEQLNSLDQLLEEVSTTDNLSVWGQKSGDRIIASVILFRPLDLPSMPPQ